MNPNNADVFMKLIVPGILLLLWALFQMFNRENNELLGRGQGGNPLGPRPRPLPGEFGVDPERPGFAPDESAARVTIIDPRTGRPLAIVVPQEARGAEARRPAKPRTRNRRENERSERAATTRAHASSAGLESPLLSQTPLGKGEVAKPAAHESASLISTDAALKIGEALSTPSRIREAFVLAQVLGPPVALARLNRVARSRGPARAG